MQKKCMELNKKSVNSKLGIENRSSIGKMHKNEWEERFTTELKKFAYDVENILQAQLYRSRRS